MRKNTLLAVALATFCITMSGSALAQTGGNTTDPKVSLLGDINQCIHRLEMDLHICEKEGGTWTDCECVPAPQCVCIEPKDFDAGGDAEKEKFAAKYAGKKCMPDEDVKDCECGPAPSTSNDVCVQVNKKDAGGGKKAKGKKDDRKATIPKGETGKKEKAASECTAEVEAKLGTEEAQKETFHKRLLIDECILIKLVKKVEALEAAEQDEGKGEPDPKTDPAPGAPAPKPDDEKKSLRGQVADLREQISVIQNLLQISEKSSARLDIVDKRLKDLEEGLKTLGKSLDKRVGDLEEFQAEQLALNKKQGEINEAGNAKDKEQDGTIAALGMRIGKATIGPSFHLTVGGGGGANSPVYLQDGAGTKTLRSWGFGKGPTMDVGLGASGSVSDWDYLEGKVQLQGQVGLFGQAGLRWDGVDLGSGSNPAMGYDTMLGVEAKGGVEWLKVGPYLGVKYSRMNGLANGSLDSVGAELGLTLQASLGMWKAGGATINGRCGIAGMMDGTNVFSQGNFAPQRWEQPGWQPIGCYAGVGIAIDQFLFPVAEKAVDSVKSGKTSSTQKPVKPAETTTTKPAPAPEKKEPTPVVKA